MERRIEIFFLSKMSARYHGVMYIAQGRDVLNMYNVHTEDAERRDVHPRRPRDFWRPKRSKILIHLDT